jgi:hypothetical protein
MLGLTVMANPLMMIKAVSGLRRPAGPKPSVRKKSQSEPVSEPVPVLVAPSFNGRTAASGAAYRGSNP